MSYTRSEAIVWAVVGLVLLGIVALAFVAGVGRRSQPGETGGFAQETRSALLPAPMGELGDHPCVERSGRAMNTSELRGNVVVLDFIFTNCGGTCPQMTAKMIELQKAVASLADVRLVSVSVDPDRDSAAALSAYADGAGADKDRWLFLRCEKPVLADIAYARMKLVKSPEETLFHQSKFVLLDRDLRVRGLYDPLVDPQWLTTLVSDLNLVRAENAR
jgi:protein SCO1